MGPRPSRSQGSYRLHITTITARPGVVSPIRVSVVDTSIYVVKHRYGALGRFFYIPCGYKYNVYTNISVEPKV